VLTQWTARPLADLLEAHGLSGAPEEPFPGNGWSGARLTSLRRPTDGRRFILKRSSWAIDWIARSTRDHAMREGFVASLPLALPKPLIAPYFGAGRDGTSVGILMPDLSEQLLPWEGAPGEPPLDVDSLDRIVDALVRLHAMPWPIAGASDSTTSWPSVPLRERLLLLSPRSGAVLAAEGVAAGERFTAGWAAFDRHATHEARSLVDRLDRDPSPLLAALSALPRTGLHGDLKLANVAFLDDRRIALIDWQMTALAPVAVELGWMLVTNSASLPEPPEAILVRYRSALAAVAGLAIALAGPFDPALTYPPAVLLATLGHEQVPRYRSVEQVVGSWEVQLDLSWIVGLLLRGWRKGIDAEAGAVLGSGMSAVDDLAWWCARATEAAGRRL
jgi:Phosphotransferase enzyme family